MSFFSKRPLNSPENSLPSVKRSQKSETTIAEEVTENSIFESTITVALGDSSENFESLDSSGYSLTSTLLNNSSTSPEIPRAMANTSDLEMANLEIVDFISIEVC